ncbi:MAG TPA: ATP-binding protein [Planctomycetota bacterium]|nr:ATP-binding protein [Planctomycetota bacterium]
MGLATCFAIVREHGGDIGIESDPGSGTAVTLLLPLQT